VGSRTFPYRGYLDTLAIGCYSSGTNAYTCEDHTGYTITTCSNDGMIHLLPIFLDHIVYPTLRDKDMKAEVFFTDSRRKSQGVVFCEMSARENTEGDLMDHNLRSMLYDHHMSPLYKSYGKECGGRSELISKLTNNDIISYHAEFYHYANITVLVIGNLDISLLLEELNINYGAEKQSPMKCLVNSELSTEEEYKSGIRIVEFPSEDIEFGSIGFSWKGPQLSDLYTVLALEVLMLLLVDTSASPLFQKFVELDEPLANDVDFGFKYFLKTGIVLIISNVPMDEINGGKPEKD
jgi:Zn-dependent M16 (insulinase) family peptidase